MEFKLSRKQLARQQAEQAMKAKTQNLISFAGWDVSTVLDELDTSFAGLSLYLVEASRKFHGENKISQGNKNSWLKRLWEAFASPFTAILVVLALVSLYTDVIAAAPGEKNPVPLCNHTDDRAHERRAALCAGDPLGQRGGSACRNGQDHNGRGKKAPGA